MNLLVEITLLLFTAGSVLAFVAAAPPVGTAAWLVLHGSRDVDQCRCIAGFAVAGGTGRYAADRDQVRGAGGDRLRSPVCRHGPFRPKAHSICLAVPGLARAGAELFRPGRGAAA